MGPAQHCIGRGGSWAMSLWAFYHALFCRVGDHPPSNKKNKIKKYQNTILWAISLLWNQSRSLVLRCLWLMKWFYSGTLSLVWLILYCKYSIYCIYNIQDKLFFVPFYVLSPTFKAEEIAVFWVIHPFIRNSAFPLLGTYWNLSQLTWGEGQGTLWTGGQ